MRTTITLSLHAFPPSAATVSRIAASTLLAGGVLFLVWTASYNYLLFHTLAEFLAIAAALTIGLLAWQTFPLSRNNFILVVGLALAAVAVLDSAHVFAHKGMKILFTPADLSTQLWLVGRYFAAVVLALAPVLLYGTLREIRLSARWVAAAMLAAAVLLLLFGFTGHLPATFVRKTGHTAFRTYSEVAIVFIFAVGVTHLWVNRRAMNPKLFKLMIGFMLCAMTSMIGEVLEIKTYRFSDIVDHLCALAGMGFMLQAVLTQGLQEPVQFLDRALNVVTVSRNALIHSRDEESLLGAICDTAVRRGGYCLAWIGVVENDSAQTIRPVKFAGEEDGYLDEVALSGGESPWWRAVRTGQPVVEHSGTGEPMPWKTVALRHGFAATLALPLTAPDRPLLGVLVLHSDKPYAFTEKEVGFLSGLAEDLGYGLQARRFSTDRNIAEQQAAESLARLSRSVHATVNALAFTVEKRDPYTAGHQRRVADLATNIGRRLGLPEASLEALTLGGLIHDIGKIYIPAEILNRPGRLTEREFEIIRTHPEVGQEILAGVEFPWPVAPMVVQHHERMDGSGYPRHLKGDDIVLEARIIAVADVMEAMASHRPYRASLGRDVALAEIRKYAGTQFDENVVSACEGLFQKEGYQFPRDGI